MHSPGAIAFQIGPLVIRWYGILMALSIVVGLWLGHRQARREGLPADDIITIGQWSILAGLLGARLYEVAFNWDYYGQFPKKILAVWEGGLAIHGGLIVGPLERAHPARPRRHRALVGHRAGDRAVGELLQRGSVRDPDEPALEALHLAAASPAGLHAVRVLPPDLPVRVAVGPRRVLPADRLAAPAPQGAAGCAVLLVHRALFDRPLPHRGHPARQLLDGTVPRGPAREPGRRAGRHHRADVDAPARGRRRITDSPVVVRVGLPSALADVFDVAPDVGP